MTMAAAIVPARRVGSDPTALRRGGRRFFRRGSRMVEPRDPARGRPGPRTARREGVAQVCRAGDRCSRLRGTSRGIALAVRRRRLGPMTAGTGPGAEASESETWPGSGSSAVGSIGSRASAYPPSDVRGSVAFGPNAEGAMPYSSVTVPASGTTSGTVGSIAGPSAVGTFSAASPSGVGRLDATGTTVAGCAIVAGSSDAGASASGTSAAGLTWMDADGSAARRLGWIRCRIAGRRDILHLGRRRWLGRSWFLGRSRGLDRRGDLDRFLRLDRRGCLGCVW